MNLYVCLSVGLYVFVSVFVRERVRLCEWEGVVTIKLSTIR